MTIPVRRAAVIGCGDISALHLDAINNLEGIELVAVCDPDSGRREHAASTFNVPGFASHTELFDAVAPDVVHITTPHHLHASIAIDALERGIHVVLEKPLAHTRAEAERLVDVAGRRSAKIGVCFQNRYNGTVRAAKELVDSGELGAVTGAAATVLWHRSAEYYNDRPWRGQWETAGGGLLMNQAIHTLDLLRWFVGPVTAVSGNTSTRALAETIEVEDTAEMVLTHTSGACSVFFATLAHATNLPVTVDIELERGSLSLRGALTITRADGSVEVIAEEVVAHGPRAYWGISHELFIADFYARLDDADPFWISPVEANATLDIIQDVYDQSYPERAGRDITTESLTH